MDQQLPPEYQEQIDQAMRRRALAQAMLQQGLGNRPQGRMVAGHYVKSSPFEHLAGIAQVLSGQYMDAGAGRDIADARRRALEAQQGEIGQVQRMLTGTPEQQVPNFVMAPDESGEVPTAKQPGMAPDPRAAEMQAQRSQFPAVAAMGKALFEQRMKRLGEFQKAAASRVSMQDLPGLFAGEEPSLPQGAQPKQEVKFNDNLPFAVPAEYTPGGPAPQRIGQGYQPTTVPGADGKPMAAQVNPASGRVDVLDKAPKTNVKVNSGDTEDPYWKAAMTRMGDRDAAFIIAGREAPAQLVQVERIRKLHLDSKGQYTGGPLQGPIRFLRDSASQLGVPVNPEIDLNNVKMQAELAGSIANAILKEGRGLTDQDREALKRAFPSESITPAQMPAFLAQYERMLRDNIELSNQTLKSLQRGRGQQAPTALRDNLVVPSRKPVDQMSTEELEARRQELLRKGGAR